MVHLGQCGTQIGTKFWDLVAHEQNITKTGQPIPNEPTYQLDTLFSEACNALTGKPEYFPRAIFMDVDPTVIAAILGSKDKNFYEKNRFVTSFSDSKGNFARVRGAMGGDLIQSGCEQIRTVLEECDLPGGSIVVRGVAGGTGGGIAPEICAFLKSYLRYVHINEVVPSADLPAACVESYNYILATNLCMPQCDLIMKYDNFKVMDMIRKICGIDWEPTWECLNHQIVQSVASLTGIRFNQKGSHAISGAELTGNLQIFPSFKHIIPSMGPISSSRSVGHNHRWKADLLLSFSFDNENHFIDIDVDGKIFAMSTTFRGDFTFNEVYDAVQDVLSQNNPASARFVGWTQPIKLGFITTPISTPPGFFPPWEPQMLFKLTNESGIKTHYLEWLDKYCQMLNRGAFQDSYLKEGMDLSEFQEAFENMKQLCADYETAVDGNLFEDGNE
jgi:tubulin alpha